MKKILKNKTLILITTSAITVVFIITLVLFYSSTKQSHAQATYSKNQWTQLKDALSKTKPVALDTPYMITKGPKNALIQVTEYIDFLCPHCKSKSMEILKFQKKYSKYVRTNYMMYPLDKVCLPKMSRSIHPGACMIAKAAVCAEKIGKFTQFHDYIFAKQNTYQGSFTAKNLENAINTLKISKQSFLTCVNSVSTKLHIEKNILLAKKLKIQGTPTLFLNNKKVNPNLITKISLGYFLQTKLKK